MSDEDKASIESLKDTILTLQQQLQATRELVDIEARRVSYLIARLLPGQIDSDTAAFIADRRDDLDAAAIAMIRARMKGGQIWREDALAVLNALKREGGQAKEG